MIYLIQKGFGHVLDTIKPHLPETLSLKLIKTFLPVE